MDFRLLGPVEVFVDGHPVDAGPPQRRAVLAALLVDAGRVVMPHVLVERVWGARPPEGVRQALYAHIARLRRLLVEVPVGCGEQPLPLSRRSGGYLLDVDPNSVDIRRFQWLVQRSREAGRGTTERSVALREALDLWRGEPLDGVAGQWAERMRIGWRQKHVDAVLACARDELDADDAVVLAAKVAIVVPLLTRKPVSLVELSNQLMRMLDELVAVAAWPLGAAGTVGVVVQAYGVQAEGPAALTARTEKHI